MAAARMAAIRGHRVTLCEAQSQTGGALRLAAIPPGRRDLEDILSYFKMELERLEVPLLLNRPLDEPLLREISPDTVILATGSLPEMPMIKGLYQPEMETFTANEVLGDGRILGNRVIVWGGNQAGLVLADHLATLGKEVVVLHRKAHFAEDMSSNDRYYLRERLKGAQVALYKEVQVDTFLQDGVRFRAGGRSVTISEYDALILADTFAPLREEANLIKKKKLVSIFIGDAKQPRHLMYAISEGEEVGRNI
jgi:NADPH-dependent 2,4-dienoyl-CoA reductase/sulfur reductase-like enzyme